MKSVILKNWLQSEKKPNLEMLDIISLFLQTFFFKILPSKFFNLFWFILNEVIAVLNKRLGIWLFFNFYKCLSLLSYHYIKNSF